MQAEEGSSADEEWKFDDGLQLEKDQVIEGAWSKVGFV